jgi:succinyl-diaminopimelate desuccinylase
MVASGSSYAKSMERFVSWGPVFPDDPQTAHVEDERLSVDTMLRATKLYAYFIYKITHQMREVTW